MYYLVDFWEISMTKENLLKILSLEDIARRLRHDFLMKTVVTDKVYVCQKGNCLAKETLLGQYRLFDNISKEVVKIKIKISNNFKKKWSNIT